VSAAARVVEIPYAPRACQRKIHDALRDHRFVVAVCHRRMGKTWAGLNELQRGAITCKREMPRFAYIAPTYRQAKLVVWDLLKKFARPIPGVMFNDSELRCDYPNGARITLFGADNPDSLRGIYLDGAVLDEVSQMPASAWPEVIRPSLSDRDGWALFIGTKNGLNYFYELYQKATEPPWTRIFLTAADTGVINSEELRLLHRDMSPEQFAREYGDSWTASMRGAYYATRIEDAEREGRILRLPYDPALGVTTAWDLGVGDATAIWFVQQLGSEIRAIDYYEAEGEGLGHYAQELAKRGYVYKRHIAPPDIMVRELGSGKSRLETAEKLGIRFDVAPALSVEDRIEAVRNILPRTYFDDMRTNQGREALRHYRRAEDPRSGELRGRPLHDWTSHGADAFGYLAIALRETLPRKRPVRRHHADASFMAG
jgi:hypothetical protein